ncbi:MAG: FG-GAP-like repeat-containing protein, partial [Acidobacteriota bacterium]
DALGAGENDRVSWWRNESIHRNAAWPEDRSIDSSFNEARGITVVDLDHDADLDVIASGGDVVQWWRNDDGVGESWSSQSALANSFVGAQGVDSGDLDGDGDPDAVGAAETDSVVSWFDNTAGDASAWTEKTIDPSFGGARSVVIGDVDGDGDPDVAGAASTDGEFAWWSNTNGDATTWSKTSISGVLGVTHAGAASIFLADFDGDSDLDVAAASSVDEEILFFENTSGDGSTWASTTVDASLDGASSVWAADFDGDGDYDIAAAATDGGDLTWYENTVGDGSAWTRAFVVENLIAGPTDLVAADFDQDGDQDIAATESLAGGSVVWFANTSGDGSTWSTARTLLDPADGAAALDVGDVDRNGTADLVVAVEVDDDLTLLSNLGGQFGLDTADISPSGLGNGVTEDLFRVVARHNGLVGEQDMELATLELLLEETPGDPLTTNEAQAILQNAFVYVDDGNGLWSAVDDTLVTTVPRGSILLDEGGVFSIPFGDGDANVRVQQAAPRTYFVILETTANFTSRGLFSFRATHLTESSSTAEDRVNDVPLRLEWARNVNSSLFDVNPFGTPEADLTLVSIEDAPDPVVPEGTVTYTVTVRNGGDWKAENVRVTNTLPGGTSFVSTSGCAEDPAGSATCTLGDISLLDTASFDITVSLDPGTAGPLIYQASASSDTPEANMGDESDTESTLVQSNEADVGIRVATLAGSYAQGVQTVQAVTVFNSGPGDEADASVTVTFPPELENLLWVCEGFGGASCGVLSGTGVLNSVSVSIPDDDFVIFWVQATAADSATGALTTTATVAGTNDFNASNDTASESVEDGDFVFGDDFESEDTTGWSGTTGGTF